MANELQTTYEPAMLLDLDATFAAAAGISRFYATRDLGIVAGAFWHGRMLEAPSIERNMMETFWGVIEVASASLKLSNADGYLNNLYLNDPRGTTVTLMRYDRDPVLGTTYTATELLGKVSDCEMAEGVVTLTVTSPDLTVFEQQIPRVLVTSTTFPKAKDLNVPIPVVFGNVEKMRLYYINDDVANNFYDYLVGHSSLTVGAVYRDNATGTLSLVSSGEYSVSTTLYPGYTVIRFTQRQVNFANAFHTLYADITGLSAERNFAKAIRSVLNSTAYGLSQSIDTASFDQAEADMTAIGNMFCDGYMNRQQQAQDVLRELMMVRGMRLGVSTAGAWTLVVDKQAAAPTMILRDGPGAGHRNLLRVGSRRRQAIESRLSHFTVRYRIDDYNDEARLDAKQAVSGSAGREQIVEHHWIRDVTTADKVAAYLARRELYGSETVEVDVTQEGRALIEGDLVTLTYAPLAYTGETLEVRRVTKELDRIRLLLNAWSASIYTYSASSNPGDLAIITANPTLSSSTPAVPTGLTLATGTTLTPDGNTVSYLQISWTANTESYLEGYELWYRRNTDTQYTLRRVGKGVVTYREWGVLPSTMYEVLIKSYSTTGQESALSSVQTITTAQDTSLPASLTGVTATSIYKAVVLRWTKPTETDFDVVEIWRSTANDSATAAKIGEARGIAYVDDSLVNGTTYYYWLRTRDRTGSVGGYHTTQFNGTVGTPPLLTGADLITTQALITQSAQIAFGLITDAHITNLSANKITAGTITADKFETTLGQDLTQAMAYVDAMLAGTADFAVLLTNAQVDAGIFSGTQRDKSSTTPVLGKTMTRTWGDAGGAWWSQSGVYWSLPITTAEGSWASDGTTDMGANQTGKCEVWFELQTPDGASPAPTIVVEAQFKKSGGTGFGVTGPDYTDGGWTTLTSQGAQGGLKTEYLSGVFAGVRYLKIRVKLTPGDGSHRILIKDPEIRFNDVRLTADKLNAGTGVNGYALKYDSTAPGGMAWGSIGASSNLASGFNIVVTTDATSHTVGSLSLGTTSYTVNVQLSWNTDWWIEDADKTASQFIVRFSNPAPSGGKLSYAVFG